MNVRDEITRERSLIRESSKGKKEKKPDFHKIGGPEASIEQIRQEKQDKLFVESNSKRKEKSLRIVKDLEPSLKEGK